MRQEGLKVSLTAVVDEESALEEEKTQFAVGMLKQHSVRVKPVEKVAEIAREVRRDTMIVRLERSEVAGLRA
jgi:hypothetical protein